MLALCSEAAGICVIRVDESHPSVMLQAYPNVVELQPPYPHWLSLVNDWHYVEGESAGTIIAEIKSRFLEHRCCTLIESLLAVPVPGLTVEVLEEVERSLQLHAGIVSVIQRLCVAPMRSLDNLRAICEVALGNGFAGVAAILDEVEELQP